MAMAAEMVVEASVVAMAAEMVAVAASAVIAEVAVVLTAKPSPLKPAQPAKQQWTLKSNALWAIWSKRHAARAEQRR